MKIEESSRGRSKSPWVFYYDGDCGFCTRVVKWLGWLDVSHGVRWVPFQSLEEPPTGLTWDDLDAAAYLDTGDGRLYPGFYAFRKLTLKVLPLLPLAPVFWFPGVRLAGTAVYRWVAKNRYRLSRCGLPGLKSSQPKGPPADLK